MGKLIARSAFSRLRLRDKASAKLTDEGLKTEANIIPLTPAEAGVQNSAAHLVSFAPYDLDPGLRRDERSKRKPPRGPSSDTFSRKGRGIAAIFLGLALTAPLSGCGFTPLYATGGVTEGLSHIDVEAPDGRTAYLLREKLDDALARDRSLPPVYRLTYILDERRDPRGLGPDNAASRYEMTLVVHWTLSAMGSGAEQAKGDTEVLITYDAVDAPYAGIAAQADSQERAAAEAARRIRLDLARHFATASLAQP